MPPKVTNARGASRKVAPAGAPVASPAKKRGRPAKAYLHQAVQDAAETPRKRGRPAKATTEDASELTKRGRVRKPDAPALAVPAMTPNKGRGRPKKDTEIAKAVVVAEEPSTAPRGRPRKEVVAEAAQTPRGRGRPPKAPGLDLNMVAGPSRVSKRSSARSKATKPAAGTAHLNPRMRTKRVPPMKLTKEEPAPKQARRGRPPKTTAKAPATKKTVGRKAADTAVSKPTKSTKPMAPRKMRGHTVRQIPDKFVAQVDQYLYDLMQGDTNPGERDQDQGHSMEEETDVVGNENLEPTNTSTGGQDEEAAEDAGTESAHVHDGAVDQHTSSAVETALNENGEPEHDMQSELNEEFAAADDEDEDGIVSPADEIDMPDVDHEGGAVLPLMEDEGHAHETQIGSTTMVAAE